LSHVKPGCTAFDCYYVDTYVAVILQNPAAPGTTLSPTQYLPRDGGFITWVVAAESTAAMVDRIWSSARATVCMSASKTHRFRVISWMLC